jgi:hypothetical protein
MLFLSVQLLQDRNQHSLKQVIATQLIQIQFDVLTQH